MDALLVKAAPKAKILKLGDRVPTLSSDDGAIDGYVWMDPQRARLMATAIAEELARADSPHALAYGARASALDGSLAGLDKEIEARTASWPTRDLPLGPGMAYYAERYELHERKRSSGESATAVDPLGGGRANMETYEDLIRFDTAALESSLRPRSAR
jgi:ABC-type Zn uptake system ZnuABC Zn-binding protein ZnuA